MSQAPQVIEVQGGINGQSIHDEALSAAASAIKPGHLIEELAAGTVQEHSGTALNAQKLFALTDLTLGKTIDDAYAVASLVRYGAFSTGQKVFGRVAVGSVAIVKGDDLQSNGDGTVEKLVTDSATDDTQRNSIVGTALEAIDNSGGSVEVFIKLRVA